MRKLTKLFVEVDLKITVESNLFATDFLDVSYDLQNDTFFPFRKPNNNTLYINKSSNHPPNIIKQLPVMINKRISDISCNENEFNRAKPYYENALANSGYQVQMKYTPPDQQVRKNRRRNIMYFNPPFSRSVKTDVGRVFRNLIQKHFPPHHKCRSLFNKNNLKISYSCMQNMGSIIKAHNNKLLNQNQEITPDDKACNCRKDPCPVDNNCLSSSVIYKAAVKTLPGSAVKNYYGLVEGDFKQRYRTHKCSIENPDYPCQTALSRYIWDLKSQNKQYEIAWSQSIF